MGPKKGAAARGNDEEDEERLQAVLFADSFERRFSPVSLETPKTLFPLAAFPLIDYALEALACSGVQDVFVFVKSHVEKIQAYFDARRWERQMKVQLVIAKQANSVGDALREIDARQLIRGDFIIITGDVITNLNISRIVAEHKERRVKDKNAIATILFKAVAPHHRMRKASSESLVTAIDSHTGQLLHYETMKGQRKATLPADIFSEHDSVQVRHDLMDVHIAVCAPEVLITMTDNFDWQNMQHDFIRGILESEILGNTLHAAVITTEYAARIENLASYALVQSDIMRRWACPLVPDFNLFGNSTFTYTRPGIYKEKGVSLAQSCTLSDEALIGSGTTVGDNTVVTRTVIGRNCTIGKGVTLVGAYLWDNVQVADGATITQALVCDNVVVGAGANVKQGCVLSFGVQIAAGHVCEPFCRVTAMAAGGEDAEDDDDESWGDDDGDGDAAGDDKEELVSEAAAVGAGGVGRRWVPPEGESIACRENSLAVDAMVDDEEDESSSEDEGTSEDASVVGEGRCELFAREVIEIVRRGVEEQLEVDNIVLEINGLKFSHDKSFADCARALVPALLGTVDFSGGVKLAMAAVAKVLRRWKDLVTRFVKEEVVFDQVAVLNGLETFCSETEPARPLFHGIVKLLYDEDIIVEDAIFDWADDAQDREEGKVFHAQCARLLEWLRDDDDDESDD